MLLDILDTPVSPELLPAKDNGEIAQRTEDLVGPYELHDFYLYYVLRFGFSPGKDLPAGQGCALQAGRTTRTRCFCKWLQQLLPPLLCPAVQAQLPARRPQGRHA